MLRRLLLSLLVAAAIATLAEADTLVLKSGERLSGRILERGDKRIKIAVTGGIRSVPRSEIAKLIEGDSPAPSEAKVFDAAAFKRAYRGVSRHDADAYCALGLKAEQYGLKEGARRAFKAGLRADPSHDIIREHLGFVKFAGEWTTEEEVKSARGLVLHNGKWVTPAQRDRSLLTEKQLAKTASPKPKAAPKVKDQNAWYDDHESVGPWGKAPVHKSKRYLITSNIKPEYAKRYGLMLDRYFDRFLSVFKSLISKGTRYQRAPVTIYPSQPEFMKGEKVPKNVGGYYRPKDRIVVTYHGRFGRTGSTRTVLVHEATHQFQHLVLGDGMSNCPIWLIEGLAVLFEGARWNPSLNKVSIGQIPRDRMDIMKRAVKAKKTIPLKTLFQTSRQRFTGFHYAHAWSVIFKLIYGEKERSKRQANAKILSELFNLSRRRPVRNRDVIAAFGGEPGIARFEEAWKDWITATKIED